MALLKDKHPLLAEIHDGKYDAIVGDIARMAAWRVKHAAASNGLARHVRVISSGDRTWGRHGVIQKMNRKTASVLIDGGGVWRIPFSKLKVEPKQRPKTVKPKTPKRTAAKRSSAKRAAAKR